MMDDNDTISNAFAGLSSSDDPTPKKRRMRILDTTCDSVQWNLP
jgi:hypothetical protein